MLPRYILTVIRLNIRVFFKKCHSYLNGFRIMFGKIGIIYPQATTMYNIRRLGQACKSLTFRDIIINIKHNYVT